MARNGTSATRTMHNAQSGETSDIYDDLSQDDQDRCDRIAASGFKAVRDGNRWSAEGLQGQERVGPFPDLEQLEEELFATNDTNPDDEWSDDEVAVIAKAAQSIREKPSDVGDIPATDGEDLDLTGDMLEDEEEPVGVEIDEDHKGNAYLPGVKPIIDEQLARAAGDFFAVNTEWKDAGKRRKDKLSELAAIAEMKRGLFKPDPDNSNSLVYHAGGLLIRIARESKTTVSVEEDDDNG